MDTSALQNISIGFAQGLIQNAQTAMTQSQSAISAINYGAVDYSIPLAQSYTPPTLPSKPSLHEIPFNAPATPELTEEISPISPIAFDPIAAFSKSAPEINLPSLPSQLGEFNLESPDINIDLQLPAMPSQLTNVPDSPILSTIALPIAPSIVFPSFNGQAPVNTLGLSKDYSSQFGAAFQQMNPQLVKLAESQQQQFLDTFAPGYKNQVSLIETQLEKFFAGNTALNPAVENAIYERTRDKVNAEYLRSLDTLDKSTARRGFTIPSGAHLSARQSLRKDAGDNAARAAVEIAINQAKMEQENLKFAVDQSREMTSATLSASIQFIQGMTPLYGVALDYSKNVAQFMVEAFNSEKQRVELSIQIFQSQIALYDTLIKQTLGAIDLYKAELEAASIAVNIDNAKLEGYSKRIMALQALAQVYQTQVDAVVKKADLQRVALDVFKSQVEAYSFRVQAKNSEYQGYTAAISGQNARLEGYKTEVDAYKATLEASNLKARNQVEQMNALLKRNENAVQIFNSKVSAYNSLVNAQSDIARVGFETQQLAVSAYQAESTAALSEAQARANYYQSINQVGIEQARLFSTQSIEKAKLELNKTEAIANASVTLGNAIGSAAGSAAAGVVSLAGTIYSTSA